MATYQRGGHSRWQPLPSTEELELQGYAPEPPKQLFPLETSYDSTIRQDSVLAPLPARRLGSGSTIAQLLLDLCIALTALYFIVFAGLVYASDGTPISRVKDSAILEMAHYGPTVFPILYAAIAGNFLKAVAAFKLERGSTVGSLEFLLSSRTVFSAVTSPMRFRHISLLYPLLLAFWALSPVGGQASLRAVSTGISFSNSSASFPFLEFASPFSIIGADTMGELGGAIGAIFISALVSPGVAKAASQDPFSNIKIPMLESLESPPGDDGWHDTQNLTGNVYASLIGLPVLNLPADALSSFHMESSYMYSNCSLSNVSSTANFTLPGKSVRGGYMTIFLDSVPHNNTSPYPRRLVIADRGPQSQTIATCNITTTFVELAMQCKGSACGSTAVRASQQPPPYPPTTTVLDGFDASKPLGPANPLIALFFFDSFVTVTGKGVDAASTPLEIYIVNPEAPYSVFDQWETLSSVGPRLFSNRFSQLINTYWTAGIAPFGVTGNFTATPMESVGAATYLVQQASQGQISVEQTVLRANHAWLAALLLASTSAFLAGLLSAIVGSMRRGPDILGSFVGLLRDNPHAQIPHGSSMEDVAEQASRHRNVEVALCDIKPDEHFGYVAVATTQGRAIGRLNQNRTYR